MWFGGGQPRRSNIEEANRHLVELSEKIDELETKLKQRNDEYTELEENFETAMHNYGERHTIEVDELNKTIYQQNLKLTHLNRDVKRKDTELQVLRKRCRMFDEVLRYKATLGKLSLTLEQAEQYANLTVHARDYLPGQGNSMTRQALADDSVNTDPAPLMIRDVKFNDASSSEMHNGHQFNGSSGEDQRALAMD